MYYPKSKIIPNQYASVGKLVYRGSNAAFEGYYHILADGRIFSGKTPTDGQPQELIFVTNQSGEDLTQPDTFAPSPTSIFNLFEYSTSKLPYDTLRLSKTKQYPPVGLIEPEYKAPIPSYPSFKRYFVRRVNSAVFTEINKEQYDNFQARNLLYNWPAYTAFEISWTTAGNGLSNIATTNRNMVLLTESRQKLYGLSQYITNYTEFAI